jgi:RHS repeat-associated protein
MMQPAENGAGINDAVDLDGPGIRRIFPQCEMRAVVVVIVGGVAMTLPYRLQAAIAGSPHGNRAHGPANDNALGRISGITTTGGATIVSSVTHQPFNGPSALTFGNDVALAIGYNLDGLVSSIAAARGGATIQSLTYGYDDNENINAIADGFNSARSQTLGYDPLYRLNAATGAYGTQAYTYDGVGNRLSGPASGATYTPATTSNQLSTVVTGSNTRTFLYDPAGMVLSDARAPGTTYTYAYNQDNRLVTAELNGTTVGAYVYNGFGQRAAKTASGATTQFLFDMAGHLIAETNGSTGATLREYIWMDNLPVAMVDDTGSSPVVYYVHTDQLGTPQKMTDASANVVWDGVFDPFGNAVAVSGTNWGAGVWKNFTWEPTTPEPTLLRFPGQYADAESALNQNWFRDYDPTIGRYVESDPVGLNGGINTYVYVGNNPLLRSDASGLAWGDSPWWPWNWGKPPSPPSLCPTDRAANCADAYLYCMTSLTQTPESVCNAALKRCIDHPQIPMIFPPGTVVPAARTLE